MSVDEIIARLPSLTPEELSKLRAAVAASGPASGPAVLAGTGLLNPAALAARESLLAGVGSAGGRAVSEGIDEALYGATG